MNFKRSWKFYAAHRNQHLKSKCAGLHGHRYQVDYEVEVGRSQEHNHNLTIPFEDFDKVEKHLHALMDHTTILDMNDPLAKVLANFVHENVDGTGGYWKLRFLPFPTSAENLTYALFREMAVAFKYFQLPVMLMSISVRETDSTLLDYDGQDFSDDVRRFSLNPARWPFDETLICSDPLYVLTAAKETANGDQQSSPVEDKRQS